MAFDVTLSWRPGAESANLSIWALLDPFTWLLFSDHLCFLHVKVDRNSPELSFGVLLSKNLRVSVNEIF